MQQYGEDHQRIYDMVQEACMGPAFDHAGFLAEPGDSQEERTAKYWSNLAIIRNRYRHPETHARTEHRLKFVEADFESSRAAEFRARRTRATLGPRNLIQAILTHARSRAIRGNDYDHENNQSICMHPLLASIPARRIEAELRDGVKVGDLIFDTLRNDKRKKLYSLSVDTIFNQWCETLVIHVVRGVHIHHALDLREAWTHSWQTHMGMPREILDSAFEIFGLDERRHGLHVVGAE